MNFRQNSADPAELVFSIVGPIGSDKELVIKTMEDLAKHFHYTPIRIGLSKIIEQHISVPPHNGDQYLRVTNLIKAGNDLRLKTNDNAILAKLAAGEIASARRKSTRSLKRLYIIDSVKHPQEVHELRDIYGSGFYLFAVHSAQRTREEFLRDRCLIDDESKRTELIERDKDERIGHGQSTRDTFHLADFFVTENGSNRKVWVAMKRFFDLIFGHPFRTPTFNEYAMFMAHAVAMRSADMSRQVGAVVSHGTDIVATGANEIPKPFGGSYWPVFNETTNKIDDLPKGRDYVRNEDRNAKEKRLMIEALKKGLSAEVASVLDQNIEASGLNDISEFGRVVHAEMDALLGCARRGVSCAGARLYCTTFPCHNCAKHIISAGLQEVVYIEPYPKSKALDMHDDALTTSDEREEGKVVFTPFVGVGPRQFVNLFSMSLGDGERIRRRQSGTEKPVEWSPKKARPRVKMFPLSHVDKESMADSEALDAIARVFPQASTAPRSKSIAARAHGVAKAPSKRANQQKRLSASTAPRSAKARHT